MIDRDRGVFGVLDDVATWLLNTGCSDPVQIPAATRLQCLWAAERLQELGARPRRTWLPAASDWLPGVVVALAVLPLAGLSLADVVIEGAVAEARDALHAVLQALV